MLSSNSFCQYVGYAHQACGDIHIDAWWLTKGGWTSETKDCLEGDINMTQGIGVYTIHKEHNMSDGEWTIIPASGYVANPSSGVLDGPFTISTSPTVTTSTISSIDDISASSGGNVTSDGYSTITARGVCWSTSTNPTIANSNTTETGTTGAFTSELSGLCSNTTYYVRAYATNSVGTSYGDNNSFTTNISTAGNALDFDGVDDYIDVGIGPTSIKTVEFWVNPSSTTEYYIDLNGTEYISSSTGTISASGFTSPTIRVNGVESTTIVSGSWQHISITTSTGINATDLDIGRVETQEEFEGKIDEVRLWDDVRTVTEIISNMCKTLKGSESNLVAYYRRMSQVVRNYLI